MSYNKLVRDKIPEIIEKNKEKPIIKILNDKEYKEELEKKLKEELEEVLKEENKIEELADMLEVIEALAKLENKTLNDVLKIKEEKKQKRGSFDKKIYLINVE